MRHAPSDEAQLETVTRYFNSTLTKLDHYHPNQGVQYVSEEIRRMLIYSRAIEAKAAEKRAKRSSPSGSKPRTPRTAKPADPLPPIIAIYGYRDFGPSDGEGSTCCPHCGANGRHVWYFICADGSKRGAMRGCLKLFPSSNDRYSKLITEAFDRRTRLEDEKRNLPSYARDSKKLASWWQEMIEAAEAFGSGEYSNQDEIKQATATLRSKINVAESRRQEWLRRNGYGRGGRK